MKVDIVFVSEDGGSIISISTMSWSPCPQLGWDNKFYMRHVSIIDKAGDYRWGAGYITVSVLWAFIQYILGWESKVLFRVKIYCWLLNFSFQQLSAQSTEIILPLQHYIIIFIFTIVKVRFNFMDTLQFAPAAHSFPKKAS